DLFLHRNANSISNNDIRDIKFSSDQTMWITTANGLNRLDLSTMHFSFFFHNPADSSSLFGNSLGKMCIDKNGNLWTYLINTLHLECFNTKTNLCTHFTN